MKNKNYHLYLTDTEYRNIITALINLKIALSSKDDIQMQLMM